METRHMRLSDGLVTTECGIRMDRAKVRLVRCVKPTPKTMLFRLRERAIGLITDHETAYY